MWENRANQEIGMNMDMYWPQQKVFFLATLALFPDKIVGKIVEPIFWWPYFEPITRAIGHDYDEDDYKHFSAMLFYYQRDGYLAYEQTPDKLFEIKSVDSKKAKNDLIAYLKEWQDGQLITNSATKPPDVLYQQELFIGALRLVNNKHQSDPRIKLSDIYGELSKLDYEAPFWELVLSYQLINHEVLIKEIGYERNSGGWYNKNSQPYADVEVISEELTQSVESYRQKESTTSKTAKIGMSGNTLYIELDGIERVMKEMRTDSDPGKFISHLINHTNTPTTRKNGLSDLSNKTSFSELARGLGFDEDMKKRFFLTINKTTVNFTKEAIVSQELADSIEKRFKPMS